MNERENIGGFFCALSASNCSSIEVTLGGTGRPIRCASSRVSKLAGSPPASSFEMDVGQRLLVVIFDDKTGPTDPQWQRFSGLGISLRVLKVRWPTRR
jgi:hypothetical protein